jgi:branched-chain amino acid transport system ATP-binding protein
MALDRRQALLTATLFAITAAGVALALYSEGYTPFVLALVALTTIVGVGLNILLGLTGQVSLGHVGFYAIGAYVISVLTLHGVNFWAALPVAGVFGGLVGALLAIPALRVRGPYLAMVTIAFAFIVQHGLIEWKTLTGGQNGLMGVPTPSLFGHAFTEREMAALAVVLAGLSLWFFQAVARSGWGKAMLAVRDSEVAARSIGLNPVVIKTAAFALSAVLTAIAGGVFAPLMTFVAPDSFPFTQSILFLLAVIVGGAGWVLGPVVGAIVTVVGPEMLSSLAEYRLLFFGTLLLVVLWIAPNGVIGAVARWLPDRTSGAARRDDARVNSWLQPATGASALEVAGLSISFGGIKAVRDVSFSAMPGEITSVIGPNGAGKTTVLNMIGGFYRPDAGSVRLGDAELAGTPAWRTARKGIARTYQTTQLFEAMTVLDNVLVASRKGRLGQLLTPAETGEDRQNAEALLAFVGYRGSPDVLAGSLPHVDRRLVEVARALATRPRVLLFDEPAAGLLRAEKEALSNLLREIARLGIAVVLVEHDMMLVMGVSDQVVVLDAGSKIAAGPPISVRNDPAVLRAYLGGAEMRARPRKASISAEAQPVLSASGLFAGYGAVPVLSDVSFDIRDGELVALLGANGAGKSTTMRTVTGLLRARRGSVLFDGGSIERRDAHRIAASGLALVPEGRQIFPELSVLDNLRLGAFARRPDNEAARIEKLLERFPRLRERISQPAGLLSGGEQQMLAIARALVGNPRVLLMDEPSLGLAPALINELFDVIAELRDEGVPILLVDQMAAMALSIADRGYVLESGHIVRSGSAAELAGDPALEAAYLGHVEAAQ